MCRAEYESLVTHSLTHVWSTRFVMKTLNERDASVKRLTAAIWHDAGIEHLILSLK